MLSEEQLAKIEATVSTACLAIEDNPNFREKALEAKRALVAEVRSLRTQRDVLVETARQLVAEIDHAATAETMDPMWFCAAVESVRAALSAAESPEAQQP